MAGATYVPAAYVPAATRVPAATYAPSWDADVWLRDTATSTYDVEPVSCADDSVSEPPRYVVFNTHTNLPYSPTHDTDVTFTGGGGSSSHMDPEDETLYHTPPPPDTQETQEDEPLRGRGMRDHRAPARLSPTGPRPRRQPRTRAHRDD